MSKSKKNNVTGDMLLAVITIVLMVIMLVFMHRRSENYKALQLEHNEQTQELQQLKQLLNDCQTNEAALQMENELNIRTIQLLNNAVANCRGVSDPYAYYDL